MPTEYTLQNSPGGAFLVPKGKGIRIQIIDHEKKVVKTNASTLIALYHGATKNILVESTLGLTVKTIDWYFLNSMEGKKFPISAKDGVWKLDAKIPYDEIISLIKDYSKKDYYIPPYLNEKLDIKSK